MSHTKHKKTDSEKIERATPPVVNPMAWVYDDVNETKSY